MVITLILAIGAGALVFGRGSASAAVDGTYYFNGTPQDEANKHATMPTATFSKDAPTGTTPITQTTKFFCNSEVHFNIHCANWVGTYEGTNIDGRMQFCSYWSSGSAADVQAGTADVELTFFAGEAQISRATATVNIGTPDEPAVSSVILDVSGTAAGQFAVVARPEGAGQALVMHYGATSTPSFFGPPGTPCGAGGPSPTSSSSPTSPGPDPSPTGTRPTTAGARVKFSDLTPKRGEVTVATASLKKCSGHAATKIQLQRKQGGGFKKVAEKNLSASCKAKFRVRANFGRATFRSFWPKQDEDHKASKSRPKTVTTH